MSKPRVPHLALFAQSAWAFSIAGALFCFALSSGATTVAPMLGIALLVLAIPLVLWSLFMPRAWRTAIKEHELRKHV